MDKMQRNILLLLPLIFITVIARFPVGLALYWVTTNLWTVGQGIVTRRLVPKTPRAPAGSGRAETPAPDAAEGADAARGDPGDAEADSRRRPPRRRQPRRVKRKKGGSRR